MEENINNSNIENANHLIIKRKTDYKIIILKISLFITLITRLAQMLK